MWALVLSSKVYKYTNTPTPHIHINPGVTQFSEQLYVIISETSSGMEQPSTTCCLMDTLDGHSVLKPSVSSTVQ